MNSLGMQAFDVEGGHVELDIGAAASVMPTELAGQVGEPIKGQHVRFNFLSLQGKVQVKGLNEAYRKAAVTAHVADVHRPLAAGSSVSKRSLIVLDEKGGMLVHKHTPAYNRILKVLEDLR